MKLCSVLTGLPASGKSTLAEIAATGKEYYTYSTDAYIQAVADKLGKTHDEVFPDIIKTAVEVCEMGLQRAIADGKDVIWDQTNLGAKKRKNIVTRMKSAGYNVSSICFLAPETEQEIEDHNFRLGNRPGKNIPANIMNQMRGSFVLPTLEEGFEVITFFNIYGDIVSRSTDEE